MKTAAQHNAEVCGSIDLGAGGGVEKASNSRGIGLNRNTMRGGGGDNAIPKSRSVIRDGGTRKGSSGLTGSQPRNERPARPTHKRRKPAHEK